MKIFWFVVLGLGAVSLVCFVASLFYTGYPRWFAIGEKWATASSLILLLDVYLLLMARILWSK